mmetsp:Transcript_20824/g.47278  ORF Transcript_20824/g.47278 Transcript_20824/m.47278 type:complete len:236 (-) Transcript_20824:105-812(-)
MVFYRLMKEANKNTYSSKAFVKIQEALRLKEKSVKKLKVGVVVLRKELEMYQTEYCAATNVMDELKNYEFLLGQLKRERELRENAEAVKSKMIATWIEEKARAVERHKVAKEIESKAIKEKIRNLEKMVEEQSRRVLKKEKILKMKIEPLSQPKSLLHTRSLATPINEAARRYQSESKTFEPEFSEGRPVILSRASSLGILKRPEEQLPVNFFVNFCLNSSLRDSNFTDEEKLEV